MDQKNTVDNPCIAYDQMASAWELIHDLLGGTQTMRSAGQRWLPMEQSEKVSEYKARLGRSFLYGALKDTCTKLASKPFAEPMTINNLPEALEYLRNDVDGTDKTTHQLAYDLLYDMLVYGKTHVFVDYTDVDKNNEDGEVASIAEEKKAGARAFINHISPSALIGWKVDENTGKLTQIRIKETRIEQDEEYTQKEVNYIRVHNTDGWELWKEVDVDEKKSFTLEDSGTWNHPSGLTLVTIYANRTGFLTAEPTLEELAWTNLTHWQS